MIRGWCPTVHAPMPSGDGLLVRVKPFGGLLPPAALRALAEAVDAFGNGVVELTSRGNLQIRGVVDAPAFAGAMVAAGLADPDPLREARRNVITVPPCDDAVVAAVEGVMAGADGLPPKFAVVVAGDEVRVDGVVVGVSELGGVLAAAALPSTGFPRPVARGTSASSAQANSRGRGLFVPVGHVCVEGVNLLHLPHGATTAATLADLATYETTLRTTPWRAFFSPIPIPGFDHPTSIAACPGAPACGSASVATRADAARLEAHGFANIHVSGCAKGCAHPGAATTLVGNRGLYDLVRHGRAGDTPALRGLTLEQAMAAL